MSLPPATPVWQFAALFAVIFCFEICCNVLVARIFALDRSRQAYIRSKPVIDRCFGLLLALLGLELSLF